MSTKPLSTEDTVTISRLEYESLKAELAELKRLIFGSKSERFIPTDSQQATLFESQPEQDTEPPDTQAISYDRKVTKKEKQQPVRALLPAHLPRQEEVIEPEDLQEGMTKIGEEVTEILEHTPQPGSM